MHRFLFFLFAIAMFSSCTNPPTKYAGEYPDDVRAIIDNKCATAGCHNAQSAQNAGNLQMDTWAKLFEGGSSGADIVPYNFKNSSLLYFVNTDPDLGPVLVPRMPLNNAALSSSEYETLRNWIASGAPDKVGNIPFGDYAKTRQKIYVTQQGCDLIAVIDAATNQIMRYIEIGTEPGIEIAHCVRFTNDGRYAYVSFSKGDYVQKIDAETDKVIDQIYLGGGSWNVFQLSDDGKKIMISDYANPGIIKFINLETKETILTFYDFQTPHGIASNAAFDTFFITAQYGNTVYKMNLKGWVKQVSIDENEPSFLSTLQNPHEILMSPDRSRYFLACQNSDEVRVMDSKTDKLIKAIKVGKFPQEFAISLKKNLIFVSCEEDVSSEFPNFKGAVYAIDMNTLSVVKKIAGPFYQIHGISVDDENGKIFINSRNVTTTGPAPHHTSECGGRNGYYNVYDLNTLAPFSKNRRYESTVDPYSSDTRFKGIKAEDN